MKFILPLSPRYCRHWDLWSAVREIYQNALDEMSRDENIHGGIDYDEQSQVLSIFTDGGKLEPSDLILGSTSKADDPKQRGKFGEGFKLSLLVLARLGLRVEILNGYEDWTPAIEHDATFDSDVLVVNTITHGNPYQGVKFNIHGVTAEQWRAIQCNLHPVHKESILAEKKEIGRVYVGGLFVGTMKNFKCGYTFEPGTIKLDRDRGMIDGFDLAYETSRMHAARGGAASKKLIDESAQDVEYLVNHATETSPAVSYYADSYVRRYGRATVPVSTQAEIQAATDAGLTWQLVTDHAKQLLRLVHSWFVPSSKSPVQRLREFVTAHEYSLSRSMRDELNAIIEAMEPSASATEPILASKGRVS
jgi:hypothetical protein